MLKSTPILKANGALLAKLGKHKVGGGCLYLNSLDGIDTKVLTRLIKACRTANRQVVKRVGTAKPRKRAGR